MPPVGNFGAISTRPGRSHGPEVPDVHGMHGNVNGCLCRIRVKARGARGVCAGQEFGSDGPRSVATGKPSGTVPETPSAGPRPQEAADPIAGLGRHR